MNINKFKVFIIFVFSLCSLCKSDAQELKGLKMFLGFVHYSDEAETFKSALPNLEYIIDNIEYKIPEMESAYNKSIIMDGFCTLTFSYNFFRILEIQDEQIYYGGIELKVFRNFTESKFNNEISVTVFQELYFVHLMNPTFEMIKRDAYSVTNELIDKLALEYYKDN
jgi:hypothetical protein